jgi:phenylacetate-CoA ligase
VPEGTAAAPDGAVAASWGPATDGIVRTGPAFTLSIHSTIDQQARWLQTRSPEYLLTYPSNVLALVQHSERHGWRLPSLREVRTFGELVEPHVRAACQRIWSVPVTDIYSSQEVGYIALQCPQAAHYHVQSENVLVEVLDDTGRGCMAGEIGRVVVTSLHNFAMPLIRYDIGDFAEVGPSCPCGRGLPVLRRIVGRQRNMLLLPDGDRRWPSIELAQSEELRTFPPIEQFQLVQTSLTQLDMLLVVLQPLSADDERRLLGWIRTAVGHPFEVAFRYVSTIPRSASGKFEDFRCELPAGETSALCTRN